MVVPASVSVTSVVGSVLQSTSTPSTVELTVEVVSTVAAVEATAVGVEDKDFGARLRAFVVPKEGVELTEDAIKEYVREHLARYKVPREVIFLTELPRNPTGKILKRELRQIEIH